MTPNEILTIFPIPGFKALTASARISILQIYIHLLSNNDEVIYEAAIFQIKEKTR